MQEHKELHLNNNLSFSLLKVFKTCVPRCADNLTQSRLVTGRPFVPRHIKSNEGLF